MNPRERVITVLEGGTPDVTPYLVYDTLIIQNTRLSGHDESEAWESLFDKGLAVKQHCNIFQKIEHDVVRSHDKKMINGRTHDVFRVETPVGRLEHRCIDGWHDGGWIHDENDYAVMTWLVNNTQIIPEYSRFDEYEERIGSRGITVTEAFRTPMQTINIDLVGTERFCMDYGLEVTGLFELFEALKKQFFEIVRVLAKCRGRYIKVLENPTISLLGPSFYRQWLLPVYIEMMTEMNKYDKRVMMHFDGELDCVKDLVAESPFQIIDSLTEPPEGDMVYEECRRAWPNKIFLGNLNVGLYALAPDQFQQVIWSKVERAGKMGFALEISEDLPGNWRESIPLVLDALREYH